MAALGALAGGFAATWIGVRPALILVVVVFGVAFIVAIASPVRTARDDEDTDPSAAPDAG
jgi:hypothetical protein